MKNLEGKRTYLVGFILVVLSGLKAQGYLDQATYDVVFNALVGVGLVTLRMGMQKKK